MFTEAKQMQCKRKDKNTLSIGSIALRRKQVESKMASSILDEKLAESARKYPVLYYKRCADKVKKTLAWKDVAKELGPKNVYFTIEL